MARVTRKALPVVEGDDHVSSTGEAVGTGVYAATSYRPRRDVPDDDDEVRQGKTARMVEGRCVSVRRIARRLDVKSLVRTGASTPSWRRTNGQRRCYRKLKPCGRPSPEVSSTFPGTDLKSEPLSSGQRRHGPRRVMAAPLGDRADWVSVTMWRRWAAARGVLADNAIGRF
jgi:hypothetical protein